jgi:hypothetical protein
MNHRHAQPIVLFQACWGAMHVRQCGLRAKRFFFGNHVYFVILPMCDEVVEQEFFTEEVSVDFFLLQATNYLCDEMKRTDSVEGPTGKGSANKRACILQKNGEDIGAG